MAVSQLTVAGYLRTSALSLLFPTPRLPDALHRCIHLAQRRPEVGETFARRLLSGSFVGERASGTNLPEAD